MQQRCGHPVSTLDLHRRLLVAPYPAQPGAETLALARRLSQHHPARADEGRRQGH